MEGEQWKEGHAQGAIDHIVWQSTKLEQWKANSDINKYQAFICICYVHVSRPFHKLAQQIGLKEAVQSYLSAVRMSVDKNWGCMLGSCSVDPKDKKVQQATLEYTPKSWGKKQIGWKYSLSSSLPKDVSLQSPLKGLLKILRIFLTSNEEDTHKKKTPIMGSKKSVSKKKKRGRRWRQQGCI